MSNLRECKFHFCGSPELHLKIEFILRPQKDYKRSKNYKNRMKEDCGKVADLN